MPGFREDAREQKLGDELVAEVVRMHAVQKQAVTTLLPKGTMKDAQ